jgi:glutathione peroxidase-family protein
MSIENKPRNSKQTFWNPLRALLTLVVLSLIALGGVSSCTSSDEKNVATQPNAPANNAPSSATRPQPVPAALSSNVLAAKLKTAKGGTMSLSDYSGKVMLVNLWATWCGPCRNEIPELVKIHKEFAPKGFEIVGLSTENPTSSEESVKNFVQSFNMDYQVGWAPPEVAIAFMQMTQRDAIPQSFIISRDGHVLKQFVGFSPVSTPPQIRQAIEEALKG